MTSTELADVRRTVVEVLMQIAPEVDPADLSASAPLRDAVDLDSMDWLNFLVRLHDRFGVDIPEADYARLRTLDEIALYLAEHR